MNGHNPQANNYTHTQHDSVISPSALTPEAIRYRQEQLRIASQAADMNPELCGARPAFMISIEQKEKLMAGLIPLLFFDGRVYFATVGQISAVRERDRSVILAHRINLVNISIFLSSEKHRRTTACAMPSIEYHILSVCPRLRTQFRGGIWRSTFPE
jgi:hypothetical protein